jgi:hypothetical protein
MDGPRESPRDPASVPVTIVPATPAAPGLTTVIEQSARVAAGVLSLTLGTAIGALERSLGREPSARSTLGAGEAPTGLTLLAGAGLGLATEAVRDGVRVARAMGEVASVFVRAVSSETVARRLDPVDRRLIELNRIWVGEQPRSERAAEAFAGALIPEVVSGAMEQLDLTDLVRRNVDLDRIVRDVDLDAVADRIDIERILERVDVNDIAARIDVEALIARLDLTALAEQVMDDLDIATLVRESSGAMAAETVVGIRMQGVSADRLVSRVVERILGRNAQDTDGAAPASSSGATDSARQEDE